MTPADEDAALPPLLPPATAAPGVSHATRRLEITTAGVTNALVPLSPALTPDPAACPYVALRVIIAALKSDEVNVGDVGGDDINDVDEEEKVDKEGEWATVTHHVRCANLPEPVAASTPSPAADAASQANPARPLNPTRPLATGGCDHTDCCDDCASSSLSAPAPVSPLRMPW